MKKKKNVEHEEKGGRTDVTTSGIGTVIEAVSVGKAVRAEVWVIGQTLPHGLPQLESVSCLKCRVLPSLRQERLHSVSRSPYACPLHCSVKGLRQRAGHCALCATAIHDLRSQPPKSASSAPVPAQRDQEVCLPPLKGGLWDCTICMYTIKFTVTYF